MRESRFESLLPSLEAGSKRSCFGTRNVNNSISDNRVGQGLAAAGWSLSQDRGKSELRRAGCHAKAWEGPVAVLTVQIGVPRGARATETNAALRGGVKRAILPAAISETTAASGSPGA